MKRLALIAVAALALTACDYTMDEGGPVPPGCCDPPDMLNVRMGQWGNPAQRCADMGGRYDGSICWHVDY